MCALRLSQGRFLISHTTHVTSPRPPSAGELREYVCSELNVRDLEVCSDPLKYATLRAMPDWQALGRRLGKALNGVSKAVQVGAGGMGLRGA